MCWLGLIGLYQGESEGESEGDEGDDESEPEPEVVVCPVSGGFNILSN